MTTDELIERLDPMKHVLRPELVAQVRTELRRLQAEVEQRREDYRIQTTCIAEQHHKIRRLEDRAEAAERRCAELEQDAKLIGVKWAIDAGYIGQDYAQSALKAAINQS